MFIAIYGKKIHEAPEGHVYTAVHKRAVFHLHAAPPGLYVFFSAYGYKHVVPPGLFKHLLSSKTTYQHIGKIVNAKCLFAFG